MADDLAEQLEELLSENPKALAERESTTFDQIAGPLTDSLVLFGAGGVGARTLRGLRSLGVEPLAFVDNNRIRCDTFIDGLRVLSPEEAVAEYADSAAFVVTILSAEAGHPISDIRAQLNAIRPVCVVSVGFLYWKYPDTFLPYYYLDSPRRVLQQADDIRAGLSLWADEKSREEYVSQVRSRLWLDWDDLSAPSECDPYFPADVPALLDKNENQIFVDCGAFDGDTIREYLEKHENVFSGIVAFEPDPANYSALSSYAHSLPEAVRQRVRTIQAAVGECAGSVTFEASGAEDSRVGAKGELEVRCEALDDILDATQPSFIKMDIEGAELDALRGARRIIKEGSPTLAVCLYHKLDDLWRLPNFINSISPRYDFYLRRYLNAVWETVCYAVPRDRTSANSTSAEVVDGVSAPVDALSADVDGLSDILM